jgi:hypothetical protein
MQSGYGMRTMHSMQTGIDRVCQTSGEHTSQSVLLAPTAEPPTSYLSIDMDEPTEDSIREAWNRIVNKGYKPQGRVSASGYGVHLIAQDVNPEDARILRGMYDDTRRVELEDMPGKPKQILFDRKGSHYAGEWRKTLRALLKDYRKKDEPKWFTSTETRHLRRRFPPTRR